MAANRLILVTLALGLVLVAQFTSGAPQCSRIKAGFYRHDGLQLIIDDQWYTVGERFGFESKLPVSDLHFNGDITAALGFNLAFEHFFLYSGTNVQAFSEYGEQSCEDFINGSELDAAFASEPNFKGVDAAIMIRDKVYFLAGCSYATTGRYFDSEPNSAKPLSDLGLPCNVDAAFYAPSIRMPIVVKGDQAWLFHGDRFTGPTDVTRYVPALREINLCAAW